MNNTIDYAAAFPIVDNNVVEFNKLAQKMCELYEKKNADYGDSFNISIKKYGLIAALTRMSDKFNRIESLILNNERKVDDEKLEDTLVDLASYAIMTILAIKLHHSEVGELLDKLAKEYTPDELITDETGANGYIKCNKRGGSYRPVDNNTDKIN